MPYSVLRRCCTASATKGSSFSPEKNNSEILFKKRGTTLLEFSRISFNISGREMQRCCKSKPQALAFLFVLGVGFDARGRPSFRGCTWVHRRIPRIFYSMYVCVLVADLAPWLRLTLTVVLCVTFRRGCLMTLLLLMSVVPVALVCCCANDWRFAWKKL